MQRIKSYIAGNARQSDATGGAIAIERVTHVAVIGAGAAGIAAARRLAGSGRSFVVLEADSRIGGRAWTADIAGVSLDLGCGWLHSADRNAWRRIAEADGVAIDRRTPAWGKQHRNLGFKPEEQSAAHQAFADWLTAMRTAPPASDRASDAIAMTAEWRPYCEAMVGYISGATPDAISIADYLAYDEASTGNNWRLPAGYGTLVASQLPARTDLRLSTPVTAIRLTASGVELETPHGRLSARCAIVTTSTSVLQNATLSLPEELAPWREAASRLPLGRDEKLFIEITDTAAFAGETSLMGNPRDARTGVYYCRPLGTPVIECFFGGAGADTINEMGLSAAFAFAIDELAALYGAGIRKSLRPLVASHWSRQTFIGGSYSCALPGHAAARATLAQPFDDRLFFAGEATHPFDFTTAHGAHDSGHRAADEAIAALARA